MILEKYGIKCSLEQIAVAHKHVEKGFNVRDMVRLGPRFWVEWNIKILEKLGITENREFLAREIDRLWWDYADLTVYPDVKDTLEELRVRGLKMGVVTNSYERDFRQVLEKVGLLDVFDVVVGIDSCGRAKPDKEIFLYTVRRLGVHPEETIYVGDSPRYDYEGAKRAGLKTFLIDRKGSLTLNVEKIKNLRELLIHI